MTHEVSWLRTGDVPWLVTGRRPSQPVVGGITFATGHLHQPVELLGVAGLLAAWLTTSLARPVEATDAPAEPVRVGFSLGQLDSSLMLLGTTATVSDALQRVDHLLQATADAEVDDALRDRARTYLSPLQPWRGHLAARWPGHRPHLSALGPVAVAGLDAAALARFVATRFGPARQVYWTNEPAVAERISLAVPAPGLSDGDLVPTGRRTEPGCVVQRSPGELFTTAMRAGLATELALTLLLRTLHRRLVEFEPLGTGVRISRYEVGGEIMLACADADLLSGKEPAARAAATQTLEDLAAGAIPAAEIDQVQQWYAGDLRTLPPHEPATLAALARRHLRYQDFPTPATVAAAAEQTSDEEVREALARAYPELLLAVPAAEAERAPFPMVGRVAPAKAEGRRFRDRLAPIQAARCSARRVGIVYGGRTTASVDFDEVALRVEVGDQRTTLVDRQFGAVSQVWPVYRRGDRLRALVDRRVSRAPAIRVPPDPQWRRELADRLRRQRRRNVLGLSLLAGFLVALFTLIAIGESLDDDPAPSERTVETVDAGTTVTLPDGTTVGIAGGPEYIEHYGPDAPYSYAVQVRMCGGEGRDGAGTFFSMNNFRLDVGEQRQAGFLGIAERPGLREGYLGHGDCSTGWLLYRLAGPELTEPVTLHYASLAGDQVTWRLPPPSPSPLSKPCPTPPPGGIFVGPVWQGCPTPTPSPGG